MPGKATELNETLTSAQLQAQQELQRYAADPVRLLALAVYREARGESIAAKTGVAATVMNRCRTAPREGFRHDIVGNVLKPKAFSSFNVGDVNYTVFPPDEACPVWKDCLTAATSTVDPTGGAVFYHDVSIGQPRQWGEIMPTVQIGRLKFYRLL